MTLRRFAPLAFFALFLPLIVGARQDPPRPASLAGIVMRAGAGTPLAGARVTATSLQNEGSAPAFGPGDVPPELQGNLEALLRAQGAESGLGGGTGFGAQRPGGRLTPPEPIPVVSTDNQGRFSFANLTPGRYMLRIQANGYVQQYQGQVSPLTLAAGEEKTDIAVSLMPAGNISGHLQDISRQPLPNVPVQLLHAVYNESGQRTLQPVARARTDDHGEYRIYWVTPGRYYLLAGNSTNSPLAALIALDAGPGGTGGNPNEVPPDAGSAFYPGTPDEKGARAIEIGPGEELGGMDWTVPPQPALHTVRGRLIDAKTGKPPTNAQIITTPVSSIGAPDESYALEGLLGGLNSGERYNSATGRMEISDLAPGTYRIVAMAQGAPDTDLDGTAPFPGGRGQFGGSPEDFAFANPFGALGGGMATMGTTTVTIGDLDIDDITVTIMPPSAVTGHLTLEGELPARPARGAGPGGPGGPGGQGGARGRGGFNTANAGMGLNVRLQPLRQDTVAQMLGAGGGGGGAGARAATDGAFQMRQGGGEYRVTVNPMPPDAFLKEARIGGVDVLESPLVLPATGTLEIVVSMHGGEIHGTIIDRRGAAAAGATAVLVPNRSRQRVDLYKNVAADPNGRFTMKGVPPGDYKLFAWETFEQFQWFDPEFIEDSEDKGSPIHLSESSVENAEVKLIPAGGAR